MTTDVKGKIAAALLALVLLITVVPLSSSISEGTGSGTENVLLDHGNGVTEWGSGDLSGTISNALTSAFPGVTFVFGSEITVNGSGSVSTGASGSGSYSQAGSTGVMATASWKVYSWNGSAWQVADPGDQCTGAVAIGLYPDGFVPSETPVDKGSWTMIRGDSAQTGSMDTEYSTEESAELKWMDRGSAYAAMLYVGNNVFVKYGAGSDQTASLVCYDLQTGDRRWTFTYPGIANYETGTPVIVGDMVYVPSASGYVFSFNWRTGPGTLDEATGQYSNTVIMTDADTGTSRTFVWSDVVNDVGAMPSTTAERTGTTYSSGVTSLIYDRGALYFSHSNGMTYCIDTSLKLIWSFQTGGSIYFTTPTVYDDYVFVGALNGMLYVLDRSTGSLIDSEIVYQRERNGRLYGSVASVSVIDGNGTYTLMFSVSEGRGMNTTVGGYGVYTFDGTSLSRVAVSLDSVGLTGNFFAASERNGEKGAYLLSTSGLCWLRTDGSVEVINGELETTRGPPVVVNDTYVYAVSYAPGDPLYQMNKDGNIVSTITGPTSLYNYCISPVLLIGDYILWANDSGVAVFYGAMEPYIVPSTGGNDYTQWMVLAGIIILLAVALYVMKKRGILAAVKRYVVSDEVSHNTRSRHRLLVMILVGAVLTLMMFVACLCVGPTSVYSPGEALSALFSAISKGGHNLTGVELDVYSSRLPRTVMALVIGVGLSVAGVIYQAIIRNPMVDPYIMGVSSGAGTAAVAVLGFNFTFFGLLTGSIYATAIAAMIGGSVAFAITMLLAEKAGGTSINYVLAGVVVGLVFSAVQTLILTLGPEGVSGSLTWLFGSFSSVDWSEVAIVLFPALALSLAPLLWAKELNLVLLGEDQARQMGLNVRRFNRMMLIIASVLASLCVAFVGIIGFVGLVVPHLCRMVLGGDHRLVMPASIAFGGFLMMAADLASRVLLTGIELPVGAITTIIGVPVFAWLLIKKGRMYDG